MKRISLYFLSFILLSACSSGGNNKSENSENVLLANVNEKQFYLSHVSESVFLNLTAEDSIAVLKNLISKWVADETFLIEAKENISNSNEIENDVNNYEKELIIASYDKELLKNMEVDLTLADIEEYFDKHKDYFIFKEKHYSIKYMLLPSNISNLAIIKKAITKGEETNWMTNYCDSKPQNCHIKKSVLKNKNFLIESLELPKWEVSLQPSSKYKYQYHTDNVLIYKIDNVFKVGDYAPLEIVKEEVTKLAMFNKKQEYLLEIKEKTFQKAKDDKVFETYID